MTATDRPIDWPRVLRALVPVARMALDELEQHSVAEPVAEPDGLRDAVETLARVYRGGVRTRIRDDIHLAELDHAISRVIEAEPARRGLDGTPR